MVRLVFLGFGSVIQDVIKLLQKNVWSEIIKDEIIIVGASDSSGKKNIYILNKQNRKKKSFFFSFFFFFFCKKSETDNSGGEKFFFVLFCKPGFQWQTAKKKEVFLRGQASKKRRIIYLGHPMWRPMSLVIANLGCTTIIFLFFSSFFQHMLSQF